MASNQYFIRSQDALHYLTITVVDWVDVFTRKEHKLKLLIRFAIVKNRKDFGYLAGASCLTIFIC